MSRPRRIDWIDVFAFLVMVFVLGVAIGESYALYR